MMTVLLVIIRSAASKVKNGLVILKNGLISPKRLKLFENVGSKSALFDTKLTWGQALNLSGLISCCLTPSLRGAKPYTCLP